MRSVLVPTLRLVQAIAGKAFARLDTIRRRYPRLTATLIVLGILAFGAATASAHTNCGTHS